MHRQRRVLRQGSALFPTAERAMPSRKKSYAHLLVMPASRQLGSKWYKCSFENFFNALSQRGSSITLTIIFDFFFFTKPFLKLLYVLAILEFPSWTSKFAKQTKDIHNHFLVFTCLICRNSYKILMGLLVYNLQVSLTAGNKKTFCKSTSHIWTG